MSTPETPSLQPESSRPAWQRPQDPNRWPKRILLLLVALALGYVAYRLALAFFPRWWAQRIADRVDGSMASGTLWGLFYGFVFVAVPLVVLAQVRRPFFSWPWRGVLVGIAVLLAIPNWLTLSVVLGTSRAAHAGERILDVDGPGFRTASAIGAAVAVVLVTAGTITSILAARRRRQVKDLQRQLDERERRDQEQREEH
ncbi:MAG: hypothetical protein QM597_09930 [Aeromicrobium sp.]|uniref:hypothetical protein n=1 Tax=Aeromicrobium sp. TaxID=1871063 RepID=UPI0039E5CD5E